jgi:4-diphosphocytidyl-2C-methyl-D-erythritol kinase
MIKSYSKVNLFLKVLKKNSNQLHNIQSSVMLLDLHDRITIKNISKKKDEINFVGKFKKDIKKKNNSITTSLDILRRYGLISKKKKI